MGRENSIKTKSLILKKANSEYFSKTANVWLDKGKKLGELAKTIGVENKGISGFFKNILSSGARSVGKDLRAVGREGGLKGWFTQPYRTTWKNLRNKDLSLIDKGKSILFDTLWSPQTAIGLAGTGAAIDLGKSLMSRPESFDRHDQTKAALQKRIQELHRQGLLGNDIPAEE